ncbi:DUF2563 family protein [Mycobacterium malmoense]|uniref:DUF2563 family protein n=1 Tax=Mycobacterium malmoense TaxID=1780 RepID=UPI003F885516
MSSRGPLRSGTIGDFSAADLFHSAVMAVRTHVQTMQGDQQLLTDVGDKAHFAAKGFTSMTSRTPVKCRRCRGQLHQHPL